MMYRVKMAPKATQAGPAAAPNALDALVAREWRAARGWFFVTVAVPTLIYLLFGRWADGEAMLWLLTAPLGLAAALLGVRAVGEHPPAAISSPESPSLGPRACMAVRLLMPLAALAGSAGLLTAVAFHLFPRPILDGRANLLLWHGVVLFSQPLLVYSACALAGARYGRTLRGLLLGIALALAFGAAGDFLLPRLAPGEVYRAPLVPAGPLWIEALVFLACFLGLAIAGAARARSDSGR